MHDFHYLPTLVTDHRNARMASADRHRLLAGLRRHKDDTKSPTLSLAVPAVRTTAEATTKRAA